MSSGSEVITSIYGTMSDSAKTPQPAPAPRGDKAGTDFSYVGIDAILEQMRRKAMKQGFELNIMVVGESRAVWVHVWMCLAQLVRLMLILIGEQGMKAHKESHF